MKKPVTFVGMGALPACVLVLTGGCGMTSQVKITGVETNTYLELYPTVLAYRFSDRNTADIYMTDLPRDVFDPEADLSGVSGQITHVHLFVAPQAGKTPIDDTACSVSLRNVVLANGQIGVYGGGGFLYPYRRLGREYLKGTIHGATMRLVRATPGFDDKLGAAELEATIKAPLDEPMAGALAERLRSLMDRADRIVREELAPLEPLEKPADDDTLSPEEKAKMDATVKPGDLTKPGDLPKPTEPAKPAAADKPGETPATGDAKPGPK